MRELISFGLWAFGAVFIILGIATPFIESDLTDYGLVVVLSMAGTLVLSGLLLTGLSAIIDTLLEIRDRMPAKGQADVNNLGKAAVSLRHRIQGDE